MKSANSIDANHQGTESELDYRQIGFDFEKDELLSV